MNGMTRRGDERICLLGNDIKKAEKYELVLDATLQPVEERSGRHI